MADEVVLAEIKLTGGQLCALANSAGQTFSDGMFGVRFILKNSFKANNSNYVIKNYVMQVITKGKTATITPEKAATLVKVQKVKPAPKKEIEQKIDTFEVQEEVKTTNLFELGD